MSAAVLPEIMEMVLLPPSPGDMPGGDQFDLLQICPEHDCVPINTAVSGPVLLYLVPTSLARLRTLSVLHSAMASSPHNLRPLWPDPVI
ncbi:hypothetical protein Dimus_025708 [Dionaea muscipula]